MQHTHFSFSNIDCWPTWLEHLVHIETQTKFYNHTLNQQHLHSPSACRQQQTRAAGSPDSLTWAQKPGGWGIIEAADGPARQCQKHDARM